MGPVPARGFALLGVTCGTEIDPALRLEPLKPTVEGQIRFVRKLGADKNLGDGNGLLNPPPSTPPLPPQGMGWNWVFFFRVCNSNSAKKTVFISECTLQKGPRLGAHRWNLRFSVKIHVLFRFRHYRLRLADSVDAVL